MIDAEQELPLQHEHLQFWDVSADSACSGGGDARVGGGEGVGGGDAEVGSGDEDSGVGHSDSVELLVHMSPLELQQ